MPNSNEITETRVTRSRKRLNSASTDHEDSPKITMPIKKLSVISENDSAGGSDVSNDKTTPDSIIKTRSRANSNLTEENVALLNDTPSRRVTRKNSSSVIDPIVDKGTPSRRTSRRLSARSEDLPSVPKTPRNLNTKPNVAIDTVPEIEENEKIEQMQEEPTSTIQPDPKDSNALIIIDDGKTSPTKTMIIDKAIATDHNIFCSIVSLSRAQSLSPRTDRKTYIKNENSDAAHTETIDAVSEKNDLGTEVVSPNLKQDTKSANKSNNNESVIVERPNVDRSLKNISILDISSSSSLNVSETPPFGNSNSNCSTPQNSRVNPNTSITPLFSVNNLNTSMTPLFSWNDPNTPIVSKGFEGITSSLPVITVNTKENLDDNVNKDTGSEIGNKQKGSDSSFDGFATAVTETKSPPDYTPNQLDISNSIEHDVNTDSKAAIQDKSTSKRENSSKNLDTSHRSRKSQPVEQSPSVSPDSTKSGFVSNKSAVDRETSLDNSPRRTSASRKTQIIEHKLVVSSVSAKGRLDKSNSVEHDVDSSNEAPINNKSTNSLVDLDTSCDANLARKIHPIEETQFVSRVSIGERRLEDLSNIEHNGNTENDVELENEGVTNPENNNIVEDTVSDDKIADQSGDGIIDDKKGNADNNIENADQGSESPFKPSKSAMISSTPLISGAKHNIKIPAISRTKRDIGINFSVPTLDGTGQPKTKENKNPASLSQSWTHPIYQNAKEAPFIDRINIKTHEENVIKAVINKRRLSSNDNSNDSLSRNSFIDDEAIEDDVSSMDAEERKFIDENQIPDDGFSLGSDDSTGEESETDSDDSFIVSDAEDDLLEGTGDDLANIPENIVETVSAKKRRQNRIEDSSDDEVEEIVGDPATKNSSIKLPHNLNDVARPSSEKKLNRSKESAIIELQDQPSSVEVAKPSYEDIMLKCRTVLDEAHQAKAEEKKLNKKQLPEIKVQKLKSKYIEKKLKKAKLFAAEIEAKKILKEKRKNRKKSQQPVNKEPEPESEKITTVAQALELGFKILQKADQINNENISAQKMPALLPASSPTKKRKHKVEDIANVPKKIKYATVQAEPKTHKKLNILKNGFKGNDGLGATVTSNAGVASTLDEIKKIHKASSSSVQDTKKLKRKMPKLKFIEEKNKLPKPQWTSSGDFLETNLSPSNEPSISFDTAATKFTVSTLGKTGKTAKASISNLARRGDDTVLPSTSGLQFKERSMFNDRIKRVTSEKLLLKKDKEKKYTRY